MYNIIHPDLVMDALKLAQDFRPRGVVGVDIAGDELMPLDPRHVEGFKKAKELGFNITVHAGESGPAANVKEAIEKLGATRIGHGYHVIDDESIYQLAREKGIHFEVSNILYQYISYARKKKGILISWLDCTIQLMK